MNKLSIEDVKRISRNLDLLGKIPTYISGVNITRISSQLLETMRENQALRDAIDTLGVAMMNSPLIKENERLGGLLHQYRLKFDPLLISGIEKQHKEIG